MYITRHRVVVECGEVRHGEVGRWDMGRWGCEEVGVGSWEELYWARKVYSFIDINIANSLHTLKRKRLGNIWTI